MNKLGFRHKIVLLLIVCMGVAQVSTMLATLATTERSVRSALGQELDTARERLDHLMFRRYSHLRERGLALAHDEEFLAAAGSSPERLQALLDSAIEHSAATHALYAAPDGSILAAAGATGLSALPAALLKALQGEVSLHALTLDRAQYQLAVVPLARPGGGAVIIGMPLDARLAQEFRSETGLHLSLFDPVNKYRSDIVSTLPADHEQQLIAALQQFGLLLADNSDRIELELGSSVWLGSAHALRGGNSEVFAVIQKSFDAEMQPYYRVKENLLMLLVQAIFVAVLGSVYISSRIVKPIRQLADIAARIGQGHYNIDIDVGGRDEIGELGSSINGMQREIARREQKILFQAQHDELTALPNRYVVRDRIQGAIARATGNSERFVMVMFDIVRFKQINDTLGHDSGDLVLQETARRLRGVLRKADTLARLGSDDFMLVQEQTTLPDVIDKIRDQLLPTLAVPLRIKGSELAVKYQFGLVEYPTHGDTAETLLRRAEITLFEAKAAPLGMAIYEQGCDENHFREFTIVSDLDRALASGAITLCYQPKVNLRTGYSAQAEVLVRWQHPVLGTLRPDEFIGVLERTGNIGRLTHWIIGEACRQCRAWHDRSLDVRLSINLSALDLLDDALAAVIHDNMLAHRVRPANFVFEITESAVMQNPDHSLAVLAMLREAGFRISLDDYGTGYSSLAQIKNLPLSELKIDRSFVRELDNDGQDAIIVRSTIDLAHSMQLDVVAEGVETEAALALLRQMGCDQAQGYLFCKPVDAAAFEAWHRDNHASFVAVYLRRANAA